MRGILVVDDEFALLDVLATLLADEGYAVQTAPDGHTALELISGEPPHLLITDVTTPGLDGWALLAQVREHAPPLPLIVMSAIDQRHAKPRDGLTADHTAFQKALRHRDVTRARCALHLIRAEGNQRCSARTTCSTTCRRPS